MENTTVTNSKDPLLIICSLLLGGAGTIFHEIKAFIQSHSFTFHVIMSFAQWLCYMSSFCAAGLTILKQINGRNKRQN
jgi:succinate-acetate transporter protein